MKRLQGLLLHACGYTVAIMTVLYTVAAIADVGDSYLSFSRFALVFLFGEIIALASMILKNENIKKPVGIIIHYSVLLIAFLVLFVLIGKISSSSGRTFTAIIIFTFFFSILR